MLSRRRIPCVTRANSPGCWLSPGQALYLSRFLHRSSGSGPKSREESCSLVLKRQGLLSIEGLKEPGLPTRGPVCRRHCRPSSEPTLPLCLSPVCCFTSLQKRQRRPEFRQELGVGWVGREGERH